jgi:hypothetical protein
LYASRHQNGGRALPGNRLPRWARFHLLAWRVLSVCTLMPAAVSSVCEAQRFRVGFARSVLEYDPVGERAFGGWRVAFMAAGHPDLEFGLTAARWPELFPPNPQIQDGGYDVLLEARAFPAGRKRVSAFVTVGLGYFHGAVDSRGFIYEPNGRAVHFGLGVDARIAGPFRVVLAGLRRDDDDAANLEGRIGVETGIGELETRGATGGGVSFGIGLLSSLNGIYNGDGLAYALDLRRGLGRLTGKAGVEMAPVRIPGAAPGSYLLDTSVIFLNLGVERAFKVSESFSPRFGGGLQFASFQEGPDRGVSPGLFLDGGANLRLTRSFLVEPAMRLAGFQSDTEENPVFLSFRLGLSHHW